VRTAKTLLSVQSDDDGVQEVSTAKGGKCGTGHTTATGPLNGKRKDDNLEVAEDVQSERETKKRRNRRDGEEHEQEKWLEEQVQEVPPPVAAKRALRRSGIIGTARAEGEGKSVPFIGLDDVELMDIEEEARAEVETSVIDASLRPPEEGNSRTKQVSSWGADDECASLREQLQQVRFVPHMLFDLLV
jgi:hypothetical protein